jgi:hypothetical protein
MLQFDHRTAQIQFHVLFKERKVFTNRMFNLFVVIALIVIILLTVREVAATTSVVSSTGSDDKVCETLPSHLSIHTEYNNETKTFMTYTEDGPTGVDGGLIYLLSSRRTCAK